MSIIKFEVDDETGAVHFINGFTKPYGIGKPQKKVQRKLDTGDIEAEVEL